MYEWIKTKDVEEMGVKERRVLIGRWAGTIERDGRTPLRKKTINSAIGYITGDLPANPADLSGKPHKTELMERLAALCVLEGWLDHYDYSESPPRPFNKDELGAIIEKVEETHDNREWGGYPESVDSWD